jgi:hypothetical protein
MDQDSLSEAHETIREMNILVERLRQENDALCDMIDDFNEAVKKAAARIPS